ncbi:MAG: bestrophin family ion channel [Myxococcota bacterium]
MDVIEGMTTLAERVAPTLAIPVASALVVTLLWWLTGWSWFDLGPWPWAIGALAVMIVAGSRLWLAAGRRARANDAVTEVGAALVALAHHEHPSGQLDDVVAGARLLRARWGRDGGGDVSALLTECAPSAPLDRVWAAVGRCEALHAGVAVEVPSTALTTVFLATLPVGLVTTTGWWTVAAIAGVSLAYLAVEAVSDDLSRPLGAGRGAVPVDAVLEAVELAFPRAES